MMKKYMGFLILIMAALITYLLFANNMIGDKSSSEQVSVITGSIQEDSPALVSTVTEFQASGGEPFWGAEFSGSTLSRSAADYSGVIITGFSSPVVSGSLSIRTHTGTSTVISITSGFYTHDMSGNPCSGSIDLLLGGQTWKGFVGCS